MSKMGQHMMDAPSCPVCDALLAKTLKGEMVCVSYTCHYGSSHINNSELDNNYGKHETLRNCGPVSVPSE